MKSLNRFILLFLGIATSALTANNTLLSQLDNTATSLAAEVVKVLGNIGMGIAVIALISYLIAYLSNPDRTKEYFKIALTIIIVGGLVKVLSTMSVGTIF